jgi:hypothetical protein
MFWGGMDEQRLKVKPINISPPVPRIKNITYNFEQTGVGGGEGMLPPPPPHPPHTEQYARIYRKKIKLFAQKM